ncbi:hypothetical protein B0I37DRAFT_433035 [Chaetomium sp. MPI-CAGE-AT-0009]|nr:hypothetical protein B0I37DRAFT_433035 [Chaetomium sp. MPI-CAGE-AT-0009]
MLHQIHHGANSGLSGFPQFLKLPKEVQEEIWIRSLSGLQVNFMTVIEKVADPRVEEEIRREARSKAVSQAPLAPGTSRTPTSTPDEYTSSRITTVHCNTDDADGWGKYSTLSRLQEIATLCRGSRDAVQWLIWVWKSNQNLYKPLNIFVPSRQADSPSSLARYPGTQEVTWSLMDLPGEGGVMAIEMPRPPRFYDDGKYQERLKRFWGCDFPPSLQVLYLVDVSSTWHLGIQEIQNLKIQAGPWIGNQFVFVDLDHQSYSQKINWANVIEDLSPLVERINGPRRLCSPPRPDVVVRVLTAISPLPEGYVCKWCSQWEGNDFL